MTSVDYDKNIFGKNIYFEKEYKYNKEHKKEYNYFFDKNKCIEENANSSDFEIDFEEFKFDWTELVKLLKTEHSTTKIEIHDNSWVRKQSKISLSNNVKELDNSNDILSIAKDDKNKHDNRVKREVDIILSIFSKEDIEPGFDSETERRLEEIMMYKSSLLNDTLMILYKKIQTLYKFKLPEFIEVLTNLEYQLAYPTNYTILSGCRAIDNDSIQEAVIAGFEKWEDKENIIFLKDMTYANKAIKKYAQSVVNYLEEL